MLQKLLVDDLTVAYFRKDKSQRFNKTLKRIKTEILMNKV